MRLGMMPHEFGNAPAASRYFMEQALLASMAEDGGSSGGFDQQELLRRMEAQHG